MALLICEQQNPLDLIQPKVEPSQHRGAKILHQLGPSGDISLLSPTYLAPLMRTLSTPVFSVIIADLHPCSKRLSHSQGGITYYGKAAYGVSESHPLHTPDTFLEATAPVKLAS